MDAGGEVRTGANSLCPLQVFWTVMRTPKVRVPCRAWVPTPQRFWAGVGVFEQGPGARLHLPLSRPVFPFQVPGAEENLLDDKHLLKPWDAKKVGVARVPLLSAGQVLLGAH